MVRRQQRFTFLWVPAAIAAILLMPGCSHEAASPEPVVSVQTALAAQKPIEQIVTSDAVLYPLNTAAITPKVTAPVRKFYVQRGDRVHIGELLAVLENRDLSAAAIQSQGNYEQAQAAYESTTGASLPEELQKAELDEQAATQALDAEQQLYHSRKKLYQEGALPRKDLDQAQVAYIQAKNQYEIAKKHLAALQSIGKKQQLKAAAGQLTAAKGNYEAAQAQLGYTEIRSPITGTVSDRPLYEGETATAGTPLLTIVDLTSVIARAHIPQDQAALLKVGDKASISAPGLSESIPGTVTVVSPAADPNSTTIEVWVKAANPKREMRSGTTVEVSIVARQVPKAIVIPASALLQSPNGASTVMTVGLNSEAHAQPVRVGIRQEAEAQIVSGLQPGERVITIGAYGLPDGTKVKWQADVPSEGTSSESGKTAAAQ